MQTENVLRTYLPDAVVCLPVSDTAYPSYYASYDLDGIYATQMLLDGVCRMLDDIGLGAFTLCPLLEMTHVPQELADLDAYKEREESGVQNENTQPFFDVKALCEAIAPYDSTQNGIAVIWAPPTDVKTDALELSYIYLYYTMRDMGVRTLFVAADVARSEQLGTLMARIDTMSAEQALEVAEPYFGEDRLQSWLQTEDETAAEQLYTAVLTVDSRAGYTGRYPYWNFATAFGSMGWTSAYGCY
jgi:hypothetical protein